MGGIIPESLGESTKAEPRLSDDEPGLLMSRGGWGLGGQRDSRANHRQPKQHRQIKSWLSKERAANGGVVHKERWLMAQAHQGRYGAGGGALT
jgi:hypothetical protein